RTSLLFLFPAHSSTRDLHSFPTRRSSDLPGRLFREKGCGRVGRSALGKLAGRVAQRGKDRMLADAVKPVLGILEIRLAAVHQARSEEHTSELQSRVDLVCRLLLEKKKMKK